MPRAASEWSRGNNSPDSDMPVDLGGEGMAERMDTIARHTFGKESQTQAISELLYHYPNWPTQQDYAPELCSADSRTKLRNCCQKNKQVLDRAGAQ